MKLIFCPNCYDIIKLLFEYRTCHCKKIYGKYINEYEVTISEDAILLGIGNTSFERAINNQPPIGLGKPITAFILSKQTQDQYKEREKNERSN